MHSTFLIEALAEARNHQGFCAPNPAVGAVAVVDGKVIGRGYHHGPGSPHAEVEALRPLSDDECRQATLYVTLEPCCHHGRTPPCTDLVLSRKIRSVVYGFADPNPVVAGLGARKLLEAGVEVVHHTVDEIDSFYGSYLYWWKHGRPRLTAKLALSMDGKTAGAGGARVQITGDVAQKFTHEWRRNSDAILTTSQTILKDDPQLNVRLGEQAIGKPVYVLDRLGRLPWNARVIRTASRVTVFHGIEADEERMEALKQSGVQLVRTPSNGMADSPGLDLNFVVDYLGKTAGLHDVWIEAGGTCFAQFIQQRLLNRAFVLIAPKWLGAEATGGFDDDTSGSRTADLFVGANSVRWSGLGRDALAEITWEN